MYSIIWITDRKTLESVTTPSATRAATVAAALGILYRSVRIFHNGKLATDRSI